MKKVFKRLIAVFLAAFFLTACDQMENKAQISSIHPENNEIISVCDSQKFTVKSTKESHLIWFLDGKIVGKGSEYTYAASPTISCSRSGFGKGAPSSGSETKRKKHHLFVVMFSTFVRDVKAWTIIDSENCPTDNQGESEDSTCSPIPEICDDDIDNDCDNLIDAMDTQDCPDGDNNCEMVAEICDDNIDNDCDNLVDAMDTEDCSGEMEDDRNEVDSFTKGKLTISASGFDTATGLSLTVLSYPVETAFHPDLLRIDSKQYAANEGFLPAKILPNGTLEHQFTPTLPLNIMDANYSDVVLSAGEHLIILLMDNHPTVEKTATRADIGDNDLVAKTTATIDGDTTMKIDYRDLQWVRFGEISENDSDMPSEPTSCTPQSEVCDDGVDNDCDGLIDAQDSDNCQVETDCTPVNEICKDGIDNDCDGLIDGQDSEDCPAETECQPEDEVCDDGTDNDCDGLVDNQDLEDCPVETECQPEDEVCDDGADNDCDGLVDDQDLEDCPTETECQPEDEVCDDGIDNDCDELVDDMDTDDCSTTTNCEPSDEICDDEIDNDCDGLVDDLDKDDCEPEPFCVPVDENCSDNIDNDCDGLIDELDTENCSQNP